MHITLSFHMCESKRGRGGGVRNTPPPTDPLWIFIFKLMHVTKISLGIPPGQKNSLVPRCGKIIWEGGGVQIFLPQGS